MAFAFVSLIASAQIQTEDFEGDMLPDGWSTTAIGDDAFLVWQFGSPSMPGGGPFASNAAIFDDDQDSAHVGTAELVSPAIDVTEYSDINLSYDFSLQDFAGSGILTVDVYDGTDWIEVASYDDADFAPTTESALDVTAYINDAFQVRFTYDDEGDWAWGAGVDNFALDGTLSTDENTISGFKMFPNPANNELNLSASRNIENVAVFNMLGQKVLEQQVGANSQAINVSNLKTGAYLMQVTADGQTGTYKFVKQ